MDRQTALKLVREQLTEHRYEHTLGVTETAIELAARYGVDKSKAELSAIFHDYAKFRPKEEMKQILIEQSFPEDLLAYNGELWHAPVGTYLVEQEAGIHDQEILGAIRWHTTGNPQMSKLEKVIFLADYIEPGRHFPGVEEVRRLAKQNLEDAVIQAIKNTIEFLMKKNQPVYPLTFETYNGLIFEKNRGVK